MPAVEETVYDFKSQVARQRKIPDKNDIANNFDKFFADIYPKLASKLINSLPIYTQI